MLTALVENADELVSLGELVYLEDVLFDVGVGTANAANRYEYVVVEHLAGQRLDLLGERGTEHKRLTLSLRRHSELVE